MIILDTNVISELMSEKPNISVIKWIEEHQPSDLFITVITIAEILRGIARLPEGKRRRRLEKSFDLFVKHAFHGRILPYDEASAQRYGDLARDREKSGFAIDAIDLIIASIAKNHNASIATRNGKDFAGCGLDIINPGND